MFRGLFFGAAIATMGIAVPVSAQQIVSIDDVVEVCERVAQSELAAQSDNSIDSHPLRGFCISATVAFVNASIASLPLDDADPLLSDLVIDLAGLVLNDDCLLLSEVSEAIVIAGGALVDPEQRAQVLLIADTVRNCEVFAVAAIGPTPQASAN